MRVKVINLARSPERRAHMEQQLEPLGIQFGFVEAIDGRDLVLPDPGIVDPARTGESWFRPGAVGCALSHRRAHESVLAEGIERALILEDDVVVPNDLDALADAVGKDMAGAEVALLSFHTERPCKLTASGPTTLPGSRQMASPLDAGQLTSAGAYVVTREACARMAGMNRPMRVRADEWGRWLNLGALDRVRCVVPLCVRKDFRFLSTVAHHPSTSWRGRLQRVARYRLPVMYRALDLRRRAIERRWSRIELVDVPVPSGRGRSDRLVESRRL